MSPSLSVVADNGGSALVKAENLADRIRRLQAETRNLAREHILALEAALLEVERLSSEIANGGEAYPVGVREIARQLSEDSETRLLAMEAILKRS